MKPFFPILLLAAALSAQAQNTDSGRFVIKGRITGREGEKVYLYREGAGAANKPDSCIVTNGAFIFSGTVACPTYASVYGKRLPGKPRRPNYKDLFIEPGVMEVIASGNDFPSAVVKGSHTQDEQEMLDKQKLSVKMELQPLADRYNLANEAYMESFTEKQPEKVQDSLKEIAQALHEQYDPYISRMMQIDYVFIAAHPDSYVSAHMMRYYVAAMPLDSAWGFYNGFSKRIKESRLGKEMVMEIHKIEAGSPGSMAKDFTAKEIGGRPISLSMFKGRSWVLIDFWASWCVPCRHSNPHLLALYHRYHDKGFEVIGISDDDDRPADWKKAVEKDGTGIWYNILRGSDPKKSRDGQPNEQDLLAQYGINSLPTKILIDKSGKIIGRYGAGEDEEALLDKKLAELFL